VSNDFSKSRAHGMMARLLFRLEYMILLAAASESEIVIFFQNPN